MSPKSNPTQKTPAIGPAQVRLLEKLCNAAAVSGDEAAVRKIVLEQVRPCADDLQVDALGNVLVTRRGQGQDRLRVMLAAHMDEVGLVIIQNDEEGFFRFETVGGIDPRYLVGKAVWIGAEQVPGVIGTKPVHLTTAEERKQAITLESLRIDTGLVNKNKVNPGDCAVFATAFSRLGPSLYAKALDDRLGIATLIELVKNAPPNIDLLAAFTVQEEVGLRGARVAAYALDPHLAIVLDATPANDLPAWDASENPRYNTRLGAGPAIYPADSATLSDPRLVAYLLETAESAGIRCQIRQPGGGGTDAGAIHKQRLGIPSISVSVPTRYPHTPISIARLSDWKDTFALIYTALQRLTPQILSTDR